MLPLSTRQRAMLVAKLPDTANLAIGALFLDSFSANARFL